MTVLIAANLAATVLRFLMYRHWVFRGRRTAPEAQAGPGQTPAGQALPIRQPTATVPSLTIKSNGHHQ